MISFTVQGIPKAQPRPRAWARKMGDKYVARVFDDKTAEGWKACIAVAALPHRPSTPIVGPVRVEFGFVMPRLKAHFRTGKNVGLLRADAPTWHVAKPDFDNLAKAASDALTQLGGFWHDDAQLADTRITKRYGDIPGCEITIVAIETHEN